MKRRDLLRLSACLAASPFTPRVFAQDASLGGLGIHPPAPTGRVLVLGAGISGLAAARRLVDEFGLSAPGQVLVLEQQRAEGRLDLYPQRQDQARLWRRRNPAPGLTR